MSYNISDERDADGKVGVELDEEAYLLLKERADLEGIGPDALLERIVASAMEGEEGPADLLEREPSMPGESDV